MKKSTFAKKLREIYLNYDKNYTNYFSFSLPENINVDKLPDELKKDLDKTKGSSSKILFSGRFDFKENNRMEKQISYAQNLLVKNINSVEKKVVVSIGIGDGVLASRYYTKKISLTGVDMHTKYLKKAHELMPELIAVKYDLNKLGELPIKKDYIDLVECCMTMHHIEDYKKLIKEVSRILKKSGKFFLVDLCDKTKVEENMIFQKVHRHPKYHGVEFYRDTEEIRKEIKKYFNIKDYVRIGPGLFYLSAEL